MVKHISKIIEETEIFSMLQEHQKKKLDNLKEFLPGISESELIEKALFQPVSGDVSKREHKKSTEKPRSNE